MHACIHACHWCSSWMMETPEPFAVPGAAGVCSDQVVDVYASLLCENIVRRHDGRELLHQLV